MNNQCGCDQCQLKTAFYSCLQAEQVDFFCNSKQETPYGRGELVFAAGEPILTFSYLKSGLVKLYKTDEDGKDQIITIAGPFDFVSLLGVFTEKHYTYSVAALEDSVICSLEIGSMRSMVENNGSFSMNLMERLGAISSKIILEALEIRKRHTHGKLAFILLKFSNDIYHREVFELPLSRREMAEYIGMTTENVIRTLSEFRREKLIRISGKEIAILDKEGLERISHYG